MNREKNGNWLQTLRDHFSFTKEAAAYEAVYKRSFQYQDICEVEGNSKQNLGSRSTYLEIVQYNLIPMNDSFCFCAEAGEGRVFNATSPLFMGELCIDEVEDCASVQ